MRIELVGGLGVGKCLGKDTEVVMYDGSLRKVQEVLEGEFLASPSNTGGRLVTGIARGSEEMFRIMPTTSGGRPFECNGGHILVLWDTRNKVQKLKTVNEYNSLSKSTKERLKLVRAAQPINFSGKEPINENIEPYFLGLWLGDGAERNQRITTVDIEIEEYLKSLADRFGYKITRTDRKGMTHGISNKKNNKNLVLDGLRALGVINQKHIPVSYLTGSVETRLWVLAGLIDSDGHVFNGSCVEITQKRKKLSEQICYLSRSLGFRVSESTKTVNGVEYCRLIISGNTQIIPTKISRKRLSPRRQKKRSWVSGFEVTSLGVGDYYGFELDGDHLFFLSDFTVTHNTAMCSMFEKYGAIPVYEDLTQIKFLEESYSNPGLYGFPAQLSFAINKYVTMPKEEPTSLYVYDQATATNRAFNALMATDSETRALTKALFQRAEKDLKPPEYIIDLWCSPEVELDRIRGRGRDFETVDLDFLKVLRNQIDIEVDDVVASYGCHYTKIDVSSMSFKDYESFVVRYIGSNALKSFCNAPRTLYFA